MSKPRRSEAKVYVTQEDAENAIVGVKNLRVFKIFTDDTAIELEYAYVAAGSAAQALAIYAEEVLGYGSTVATKKPRPRKSKKPVETPEQVLDQVVPVAEEVPPPPPAE